MIEQRQLIGLLPVIGAIALVHLIRPFSFGKAGQEDGIGKIMLKVLLG
jgi:hypothetical protein